MMLSLGMFTDSFMINAWISGTMVAIICAFVGFFVVIRRSVFAAHALPQAGFAGGAGAVLWQFDPMYGLLTFSVLGALLIGYLSKKEKNDVTTALILVAALGVGALFLGLTDKYAMGAYVLLFGQIVGVSFNQAIETVVLGTICIFVLLFLYRPLVLTSLSKEIAEARGVSTSFFQMCFLVLVGVVCAITVPIVGALLSFSLLVAPTAASIYITSNPKKVMFLSIVLSLIIVWSSLILAYLSGWPIGFFVAIIGAIFYVIARLIAYFK
ncbi:MAG: iron chelate uptake ABC transporter family permease subunit [Clostridium sp.]|nr:iron chelate uptake ABC transporter family permease subunit [Clostridium sp.]